MISSLPHVINDNVAIIDALLYDNIQDMAIRTVDKSGICEETNGGLGQFDGSSSMLMKFRRSLS